MRMLLRVSIPAQAGNAAAKGGTLGSTIEKILADLASNQDVLNRLRRQGMSYARECLTWDAKAQATTQVLKWAVRRGPKPDLSPPKVLYAN